MEINWAPKQTPTQIWINLNYFHPEPTRKHVYEGVKGIRQVFSLEELEKFAHVVIFCVAFFFDGGFPPRVKSFMHDEKFFPFRGTCFSWRPSVTPILRNPSKTESFHHSRTAYLRLFSFYLLFSGKAAFPDTRDEIIGKSEWILKSS